jgi:5-methyltetrahydrofolate--homocysteine methyltransferase
MASSHHIQPDTPLANILAMYDPAIRYRHQVQPQLPGRAAPVKIATIPAFERSQATGKNVDSLLDELYNAVIDGQQEETQATIHLLLAQQTSPADILYEAMIPAMQEVGRQFEIGSCFVPEMLVAAHAMQGGLDILKPLLAKTELKPIAKLVIGTVQSDIHDIGKNLVGMMFEGAGFEVVDLGVNVPPEKFVEAAGNGADLIGISALLTTTMPNIPVTIQALADAGVRDRVKVIIGGAPITPEFAGHAGADGFAADASQAVTVAKNLLGLA